ncbi:MAG: efflux RND transporter periplasmic adaptor subunit [Propionivibrio sp.]
MKPSHIAPRIAVLFVCAVVLTACSDSGPKQRGPAPPVPVSAAQAVARDMPVTLQVVGRGEAFESVVVKSRLDGQVEAVLFTEGRQVKRGDVLIRLDPADYAARLQQAEATFARDAALVAKARADSERYAMLKERKFVSEEKVSDVRTSENTARANQRASQSAVDLARLQLSYATIHAPIDGVIGARLVFPGTVVKNNDTPLAVINRVRPLLVSFTVPEKYLPRLRAALKSRADGVRVDIAVPGDDSPPRAGRLRFIDNTVDASTGTILMKAEVANDDEQLAPGQFLSVSLLLDTLPQAVTVPDPAIQQGADGNYVYVVKDDGRVDLRPVEVSASDAGVTAVAKGLQVGETVVTDGHLRLEPGVKVTVRPPAGSAANAADDTDQSGRSGHSSPASPSPSSSDSAKQSP